jgi:hypothetical protein
VTKPSLLRAPPERESGLNSGTAKWVVRRRQATGSRRGEASEEPSFLFDAILGASGSPLRSEATAQRGKGGPPRAAREPSPRPLKNPVSNFTQPAFSSVEYVVRYVHGYVFESTIGQGSIAVYQLGYTLSTKNCVLISGVRSPLRVIFMA